MAAYLRASAYTDDSTKCAVTLDQINEDYIRWCDKNAAKAACQRWWTSQRWQASKCLVFDGLATLNMEHAHWTQPCYQCSASQAAAAAAAPLQRRIISQRASWVGPSHRWIILMNNKSDWDLPTSSQIWAISWFRENTRGIGSQL